MRCFEKIVMKLYRISQELMSQKKQMKIYRIASVKDKIQKYKIDDPFLTFFLQKYENLIPWNQIESSDDINAYIKSSLLPELQTSIDPASSSNRYLKEIDLEAEYRQNPGDPQVQQAWAIYQQDPEKAQDAILEAINGQKHRIFNSWWKYFTSENDVYAQTPSFAYTVLKPIFDKSKANNKRSTMPLNEMAVASLYSKIQSEKGMEQFRVDKQYAKEVSIANQKSTEVVKGTKMTDGEGWIRLPSQQNDPQNFQENVDKLVGYSVPNGWCTGSGMAVPYLSKGDFYLYVVDGKAEVAIRMDGDRLAEIQGERNQAPFMYTEEIEDFLQAKGIDPSNDYHYKELMEAKKLNENLGDPEKYQTFVEQITKEPRLIEQLSKENRTNPAILGDVAKAIDKGIREQSDDVTHSHNWKSLFSINNYVGYYANLPSDIRKKLFPETVEFVKTTILRSLDGELKSNFFKKIENLPKEFLEDNKINDKIQNTLKGILDSNPWKMYGMKDETLATFPESLLEKAKQHPISQTIEKLRKADPDEHPEAIIAEDWQKEPDDDDYKWYSGAWRSEEHEERYKQDMEEWEKRKKILEDMDLTDIRGVHEAKDALEDAWSRYIEKDLSRYEEEAENSQSFYTDYYEDEGEEWPAYIESIRELAHDLWNDRIINDPKELDYAPEDIRYNYTEDYDREDNYTTLWLNYFKNGHWGEVDSMEAKEVIEQMDGDQIKQLVQGLVASNADVDITELPSNVQDAIYGYEEMMKRREEWKNLEEQGQQTFPFHEEVSQNDYTVNDAGEIVPVYKQEVAALRSWYKMAKSWQCLRVHIIPSLNLL